MTQRQRINARRRYRAARETWRNYQATTRKKTKRGAVHDPRRFSRLERRMFRGMAKDLESKLQRHFAEKWWQEAQKRKGR